MPSAREIRRRIRSIKNTAQITRAMEMVAAAKMRRAQQIVTSSRPYAERIATLVAGLAAITGRQAGDVLHPLLVRRPRQRRGLILITADRGLCGPINAYAIRDAAAWLLRQEGPTSVLTIGRKGRDFMVRHGRNVIAEISGLADRPTVLDIAPIARVAIDAYTRGELDEVTLIYNRFVSTVVQRITERRLLPVEPRGGEEAARQLGDYLYEPDPATVLSGLLPRYVEVQVYQALLESVASEQSARMVAMHNATENARDIIQSLTLSYNKARQAGITKEILEIAAGAEALRQAGE
ncbi:MAG: ATP synthase F1 subunit gamma [Chloroflexi bacterium]|nr:ATP synthase F1 subunit gamma [Chloroflexota bacterium]